MSEKSITYEGGAVKLSKDGAGGIYNYQVNGSILLLERKH